MNGRLNVQVRNLATGSLDNNSMNFDIFSRIADGREVEVVGDSVRFRMRSLTSGIDGKKGYSKNKWIYVSYEDWTRFIQWRRDRVLELFL